MDEKRCYYKFRSLQNIKYFLDILIGKRLYAARYDELNDPMEGQYTTDAGNRNLICQLKEQKHKVRICSLSKDYRHTLMWSHYADGHKGCCFEVKVKDPTGQPVEVKYETELPKVDDIRYVKELLSYKSILWKYEDEVRCFRKSSYCNVEISQIIFGERIKKADYNFYEKLVKAIDDNIEVRQITEEEIISGYDINL